MTAAALPHSWRDTLSEKVNTFIDTIIEHNKKLVKELDQFRDERNEIEELLDGTPYSDMTTAQAVTVLLNEVQRDEQQREIEETMRVVEQMCKTHGV